MSTGGLPVAASWFVTEPFSRHVTRVAEPHVGPLLRANTWHVRGAERDLLVDCGLGVASMRGLVSRVADREPVVIVTHAHLDHMGSAHEFSEVWAHEVEPLATAGRGSLRGPELAVILGVEDELPAVLVDAVPHRSYDLDSYLLQPVSPTRLVSDGDRIDLGDREIEVLHLPGHTPGSIALHDPAHRSLFSGDVVYDDLLLDELPESDIPAYLLSMQRLLELSVDVVYPGHGDPFDGRRLHELARDYLTWRG